MILATIIFVTVIIGPTPTPGPNTPVPNPISGGTRSRLGDEYRKPEVDVLPTPQCED